MFYGQEVRGQQGTVSDSSQLSSLKRNLHSFPNVIVLSLQGFYCLIQLSANQATAIHLLWLGQWENSSICYLIFQILVPPTLWNLKYILFLYLTQHSIPTPSSQSLISDNSSPPQPGQPSLPLNIFCHPFSSKA